MWLPMLRRSFSILDGVVGLHAGAAPERVQDLGVEPACGLVGVWTRSNAAGARRPTRGPTAPGAAR